MLKISTGKESYRLVTLKKVVCGVMLFLCVLFLVSRLDWFGWIRESTTRRQRTHSVCVTKERIKKKERGCIHEAIRLAIYTLLVGGHSSIRRAATVNN